MHPDGIIAVGVILSYAPARGKGERLLKKLLIPCVAIFAVLCVCLVVFQIKNPPPPDIKRAYTENKVNTLLYKYALDDQTNDVTQPEGTTTEKTELPTVVFGMMIERATGDIFEYYFTDTFGNTEHALSTETDKTTVSTEKETEFNIDTKDFIIPTNYDFDTPEGDEIKIYLNTSKGVRLKAMTNSEFENSEYRDELEKMISIYKGAETK